MVLYVWKDRQLKMATTVHELTTPAASVGQRLRALRKERHLTQTELARQIGIQQSDLSRMEKGEYRVSLDNLFKILAVFEIKIADFFQQPAASDRLRRPLSHEDMQLLHLLRELDPEARQEVQEFVEFKVRRARAEHRARAARRSGNGDGS